MHPLRLGIAAIGAVVVALLAVQIHRLVVTTPLFPRPQVVPSVAGPAPPPPSTAAVERARELVRAAILEQNLPGVSVAVGRGSSAADSAKEGALVWAEGFGWRDVGTRAPVTPDTRFNIGTAATRIAPFAAPLGLVNTGADAAKEWSPEAIGEEGEDFPPLAFLRHTIWQPLGLMPAEYPLPGDRATFYVPRSEDDPRRGRRLMPLRDLACCADGMAFYSTPADLVRFALATNAGSIHGELAGGLVMSLVTERDHGIVVAVTSHMAHAHTSSLALRIRGAFAERTR